VQLDDFEGVFSAEVEVVVCFIAGKLLGLKERKSAGVYSRVKAASLGPGM